MTHIVSRNRSKFLMLVFLTAFSCRTSRETPTNNERNFQKEHPEFSTRFEQQATAIYKEKELYGDFIFAIVDKDGLAYSFALNRELLERKKSSLNNDSPIYIASSTKAFTGTLLKILEDQNVLDLNKSIRDYLPQLKYSDSINTRNITIKNLLNHTHGTFSTPMAWKTAYLGYSGKNEELISDLNSDFVHDPSGQFRYSNVGPIIAGIVVENVMGKTWKSEMTDHIFKPLKMNHTSANVSDFKLGSIRPSFSVSKEKGIVERGFYKEDITMHAAGGIISTVNDLSLWLQANINQDTALLKKTSWPALHTTTTLQDKEYFTYKRTGYSLGWDVANYGNKPILTRFGNWGGISFHMSFMPDKKIGVIAFSNDNRAYLLPHLLADYGYNLLNSQAADTIFDIEKSKFNKGFESENEIIYPDDSQLLKESKKFDAITGMYRNDANWPTIHIIKSENRYTFMWGILNGNIYENKEGGLFTNLGVMTRDFEIKNDTLISGSLIYKKVIE